MQQPVIPQQSYPQPQHVAMQVPSTALAAGPFAHPMYTVKRSYWSFLGRVTRVYAPDGMLVAYIKRPVMKWKEEMTIFADEAQSQPVLVMRARQAIAMNLIRDVFDAATGARVGIIRQKGLKSMFRDTWELLDEQEQVIGMMQEDGSSFLRRMFPLLLGKWHIELYQQPVSYIKQVWRFFAKEYTLDLSQNNGRIDPRFAMALAVLALMAESRREQAN